jgi:hypothetical protein
VFEWHNRFSEGREDVEDDEWSGHPVMMKANVIRMIAEG